MKQTIHISNEQLRNRAALIVSQLPLEEEHTVDIRPRKKSRTAAQNAYMWRILTIIGAELGMSKDEANEVYKEQFLVPIFCRDNSDFAELYEVAQKGAQTVLEREKVRRTIAGMLSTTKCNTRQMSELLDDIQYHAASLGIKLPAPDYR